MSIKCFDHFKFRTQDLLVAYQQVSELRPRLRQMALNHAAYLIARDAVRSVDKEVVQGRKPPRSPFSTARRAILDRRRKILGTGSRDPEVDFEFQVFLFPFRGSIYGRVFTEQSKWVELVTGQSWADDFSYWDSHDRPKGVPAGEWDVRGTTWKMIYAQDPSGSPCGAGLSVDMTISLYEAPYHNMVKAAVPSLEDRARYQAHDRLLDEVCRPRLAKIENASMSQIMQIYSEAEEWSKTPEGTAAHAAEAARVQPLLPDIEALLADY